MPIFHGCFLHSLYLEKESVLHFIWPFLAFQNSTRTTQLPLSKIHHRAVNDILSMWLIFKCWICVAHGRILRGQEKIPEWGTAFTFFLRMPNSAKSSHCSHWKKSESAGKKQNAHYFWRKARGKYRVEHFLCYLQLNNFGRIVKENKTKPTDQRLLSNGNALNKYIRLF